MGILLWFVGVFCATGAMVLNRDRNPARRLLWTVLILVATAASARAIAHDFAQVAHEVNAAWRVCLHTCCVVVDPERACQPERWCVQACTPPAAWSTAHRPGTMFMVWPFFALVGLMIRLLIAGLDARDRRRTLRRNRQQSPDPTKPIDGS